MARFEILKLIHFTGIAHLNYKGNEYFFDDGFWQIKSIKTLNRLKVYKIYEVDQKVIYKDKTDSIYKIKIIDGKPKASLLLNFKNEFIDLAELKLLIKTDCKDKC